MAKIPVETLTDDCWEECPNFEVEIFDLFGDGLIAYRILKCEHLKMCKYAIEEAKKWNKE